MKVLAGLRSAYLYTALTVAVAATAFAVAMLLWLAFEQIGLGEGGQTASSIRERLSGAVAVLIFAVPIGGVHLWLIRGTLADATERVAGPRHFYLNAWIVAGLFLSLLAIFMIGEAVALRAADVTRPGAEVARPLGTLIVAICVALAGWRWRDATPGARRVWQLIGAFATLGIATFFAASSLGTLIGAIVGPTSRSPAAYPPPHEAWSALVGLVGALAMWAIGLRWQWKWRDEPLRIVYAAAGYGIGLFFVALAGSDLVARLISVARGSTEMADVARSWSDPIIGLFFVALHLPWLMVDRGRIGLPARITDRVVLGITALVGLATVSLSLWAAWSFVAQDVLRLGPVPAVVVGAAIPAGDQAVGAGVLGVLLYVPAWTAFLRATRGEPRSGLRRAYVFTAISLSLIGVLVSGVVVASNAISLALGAAATDELLRTTIDTAGATVVLAAVLALHLWVLVRDLRASRAAPPVLATVRPQPADQLLALLEDVASGAVPPADAAVRIRAGTVSVSRPGKIA